MKLRLTHSLPLMASLAVALPIPFAHATVTLLSTAPASSTTLTVSGRLYEFNVNSLQIGESNLQWTVNAWLPEGGAVTGGGAISIESPPDLSARMLKLNTMQLDPNKKAGVVYNLRLDGLKYNTRYRVTVNMGTYSTRSTKVSLRLRTSSNESPYDEAATKLLTVPGAMNATPIDMVVTKPQGTPNMTVGNLQLRIYPTEAGVPVYISKLLVEEIKTNPLNMVEDLSFGKPSTAVPLTMDKKMFGLHVNELGSHNGFPVLGQEVYRLWGTDRSYWFSVQSKAPETGAQPDYSQIEYRTNYFLNKNPAGSMIYTIGQTPRWAVEDATVKGCMYADTSDILGYDSMGQPIYFRGVCSAPSVSRLNDFEAYVKALASSAVGQKIKYFEIWNEPGFGGFFQSSDGARRLAEMTRRAKKALNEVGKGQLLIGPAVTGAWMDEYLDAGAGQYIDIYNFHGYFTPYATESELASAVANVKLKMRDWGQSNKPIWNTEGGAYCGADKVSCNQQPTEDVQLGMIPRALAVQWANGVSNADYFFMEGWVPGEPWTALASRPSNPAACVGSYPDYCTPYMPLSPLGKGFAKAGDWLKNGKLTSAYMMPNEKIYIFKYTLNGTQRYLIWNASATDISVSAPSAWAIKSVTEMGGQTYSPGYAFTLKARSPVLLMP